MRQKILVTGGAGFVGSHLCERLVKDGHKVISLDNYFSGTRNNHIDGVEYREGHTSDITSLVPERADLVYHLGEYSRVEQSFFEIERVWELNVWGTFAVLEYCRYWNTKIVYAGSSTKFADHGTGKNQSPYAWSKSSNTELVKNYAEWFGVPYAITYFYNVYGPRERGLGTYATLIGIFKELYKRGQPLTVTSPGTQMRTFTHIADIIDALILVGEKGEGDEYGIGSEESYSVLEVAKMFKSEILMMPPRRGNRMVTELRAERTKALGWQARCSLKEDTRVFIEGTKVGGSLAPPRVLVFTTTCYPDIGPAEEALLLMAEKMPNIHFDIITACMRKDCERETQYTKNVTIHRIGSGTRLDKYLLPIEGATKARALAAEHTYLFVWSLVASYGALAASRVSRSTQLPLLITLADQEMRLPTRIIVRSLLRSADQIYASSKRQEATLQQLLRHGHERRSLGEGDAFANAMRFTYADALRFVERKNNSGTGV